MLILLLLNVLIIIVFFMKLPSLNLFIYYESLCLIIPGIYKNACQIINIKNQVFNYYFGNALKVKKLETRNILIDEKNYRDLMIYFTRPSQIT